MENILLFGATGRVGKLVLNYALQQGYHVTALVRDPEKLTVKHDNLKVVKGSSYELKDVEKAVEGCNVIISTLNNMRASDNPWARPVSESNLMEQSIKNVLSAIKDTSKIRLINVTAQGAGENNTQMPFLLRLLLKYSNLKVVYKDHDNTELVVKNSDTNWTIVRPVVLSGKARNKKLLVNDGSATGSYINRQTVAKFLIDIINDSSYFKKAVTISEK
jgi:putative NADH-flavin reductase